MHRSALQLPRRQLVPRVVPRQELPVARLVARLVVREAEREAAQLLEGCFHWSLVRSVSLYRVVWLLSRARYRRVWPIRWHGALASSEWWATVTDQSHRLLPMVVGVS